MPKSSQLFIGDLSAFRDWLLKDGWSLETPNEPSKVLQARHVGRKHPLILFHRGGEVLDYQKRDKPVVRAYMRQKGPGGTYRYGRS